MKTKLILILAAVLLTAVITREEIAEYLGFGQAETHDPPIEAEDSMALPEPEQAEAVSNPTTDSLYRWDEQLLMWVPEEEGPGPMAQLVTSTQEAEHPQTEPIDLAWEVLMDIRYELRYFSELDMEIYAPVFPKAIKALDGKEVIIEGYVIPFDEEGELLSLSFNPYAACFFCGQASPASVISLYLKNKRKRYKVDDFRKFRGTLHLNSDDPNEFYYILRNAREE
jgi:hypothetical protein